MTQAKTAKNLKTKQIRRDSGAHTAVIPILSARPGHWEHMSRHSWRGGNLQTCITAGLAPESLWVLGILIFGWCTLETAARRWTGVSLGAWLVPVGGRLGGKTIIQAPVLGRSGGEGRTLTAGGPGGSQRPKGDQNPQRHTKNCLKT